MKYRVSLFHNIINSKLHFILSSTFEAIFKNMNKIRYFLPMHSSNVIARAVTLNHEISKSLKSNIFA